MIGTPSAPFGIPAARLRQHPYLHLDPAAWQGLCDRLTGPPHEGLQLCRYDSRPGPNKPPRASTAVLEAAAFVAAVTGSHSDRLFLRAHLDMVLASRGMDMIGIRRGEFLAALAFAYDVLTEVLDEPEVAAVRRSLTDHAGRAAEAVRLGFEADWPMESPKAVATLAGLNLAGLALLNEEPDAASWIEVSDLRLDIMLDLVATDGWWPTGFEDWNLLLPLLTRVGDAWQRLAGRDRFDHGLFREAWATAIHGLAPGGHDVVDVDHVGREDLSRRQAGQEGRPEAHYRWLQEPCTWVLDRLAQRFTHPGFRLAADRWRSLRLGRGSPWSVLFERARPTVSVPEPDRPHHLFGAHGLAIWRSGWEPEATCVAFATGPAYGTSERRWTPNTPLDADANHLLIWALGEALAIDTGRMFEPLTQYHNTVLVDGEGQLPPAQQRPGSAQLAACWLSRYGGALVGRADGCYPPSTGLKAFQRHLALAPGYVLIWDLLASDRRCRYEWLLHTHGNLEHSGGSTEARVAVRDAGLLVQALRPHQPQIGVRHVATAPGHDPICTELRIATAQVVSQTQFLVLLTPTHPKAPAPVTAVLETGESSVGARLTWSGGRSEHVLFPTRGRGITLEHLISDAACLALRRQENGDWERLMARRVSQVLVPGGEVLSASQPVDVALTMEDGSLVGEIDSPTGATLTLRCPFVPRGVLVDGQNGRASTDRAYRLVSVRVVSGRHHLKITGR